MGSNKINILCNGPRLCGKGYLASWLQHNLMLDYGDIEVISCKTHLYKLVQVMFNITEDEFFTIYEDRENKEVPRKEFMVYVDQAKYLFGHIYIKNGFSGRLGTVDPMGWKIPLTVREAMIWCSECICKPSFGSNYFGSARAKTVLDSTARIIIDDSSSAFNVNGVIQADEVYPLIDVVGQENILLLRIHRDGFTFEGDSRKYVPNDILDNTIDIYNNGTLKEYLDSTTKVVKQFIDERIGG